MEEMRASGSSDREAFAAKRKELSEARDKKLKEKIIKFTWNRILSPRLWLYI